MLTFKQKFSVSDVCHFFLLQLNMAKDSETVLEGFQEGPLKFSPTYKFDVGTDTYDTRWVMPGVTNSRPLTRYYRALPGNTSTLRSERSSLAWGEHGSASFFSMY